jgi:hypothetical protein
LKRDECWSLLHRNKGEVKVKAKKWTGNHPFQ